MNEEKKLREALNDEALDTVIGGAADPAAPMPTGAITYKCACGHVINASTRDMYVTCPKCKRKYKVKKGKLVPA